MTKYFFSIVHCGIFIVVVCVICLHGWFVVTQIVAQSSVLTRNVGFVSGRTSPKPPICSADLAY